MALGESGPEHEGFEEKKWKDQVKREKKRRKIRENKRGTKAGQIRAYQVGEGRHLFSASASWIIGRQIVSALILGSTSTCPTFTFLFSHFLLFSLLCSPFVPLPMDSRLGWIASSTSHHCRAHSWESNAFHLSVVTGTHSTRTRLPSSIRPGQRYIVPDLQRFSQDPALGEVGVS